MNNGSTKLCVFVSAAPTDKYQSREEFMHDHFLRG